jgi:hypothetical protein
LAAVTRYTGRAGLSTEGFIRALFFHHISKLIFSRRFLIFFYKISRLVSRIKPDPWITASREKGFIFFPE